MRKKRTTRPMVRGLRLGAAALVAVLGGWLLWLVGDPGAAFDQLREAYAKTDPDRKPAPTPLNDD